jgi:hypothetical protein
MSLGAVIAMTMLIIKSTIAVSTIVKPRVSEKEGLFTGSLSLVFVTDSFPAANISVYPFTAFGAVGAK